MSIEETYIFGRKPVLEVLSNRPNAVARIFVSKTAKLPRELAALISGFEREGGVVDSLRVEDFNERFPDSPRGVAASVVRRQSISLEELTRNANGSDSLLLVLDEIQDGNNLGSLFRLAAAAGIDGVILSKRNSASVNETVRRVSCGGTELVDRCVVNNLNQALKSLKKQGYWIVGTDSGDLIQDLYQIDLPKKIALVLGSEGTGMRQLTQKECDFVVKIPMPGLLQSLNVAQAGAVMIYEILRQNSSHKTG